MYINFKEYRRLNLNPEKLVTLLAIKNGAFEFINSNTLSELDTDGYTTYIKGTAKQDKIHKVRLSKKGKDLFSSLEEVEVSEDSIKIFNWLKTIYLSSDRSVGNEKKTKILIEQFSSKSGIRRNCLAYLIQTFIKDESQFEWSKVLQYLFFKPDSVFDTRFDLNASKLYQYYLKHESHFISKFRELGE